MLKEMTEDKILSISKSQLLQFLQFKLDMIKEKSLRKRQTNLSIVRKQEGYLIKLRNKIAFRIIVLEEDPKDHINFSTIRILTTHYNLRRKFAEDFNSSKSEKSGDTSGLPSGAYFESINDTVKRFFKNFPGSKDNQD